MGMWQTVAAERGALADDLVGLAEARWETPSLCTDWTVRQVLAHMTSTARTTPAGFFFGIVRSGFRFDAFLDRQIDEHLGSSPAETLAGFGEVQHSTDGPPGPALSWLGETIVHAEDIRRPLGITHDYPLAALVELADFYKRSNALIGAKTRIRGVQLQATDTDWSHGSGSLAQGPMLSLLMAMTGRKAAVADLIGPGAEMLRQRR